MVIGVVYHSGMVYIYLAFAVLKQAHSNRENLPDGEGIHRNCCVLEVPGQQDQYLIVPVLQAAHVRMHGSMCKLQLGKDYKFLKRNQYQYQ